MHDIEDDYIFFNSPPPVCPLPVLFAVLATAKMVVLRHMHVLSIGTICCFVVSTTLSVFFGGATSNIYIYIFGTFTYTCGVSAEAKTQVLEKKVVVDAGLVFPTQPCS